LLVKEFIFFANHFVIRQGAWVGFLTLERSGREPFEEPDDPILVGQDLDLKDEGSIWRNQVFNS
jgi:hypothetical protein